MKKIATYSIVFCLIFVHVCHAGNLNIQFSEKICGEERLIGMQSTLVNYKINFSVLEWLFYKKINNKIFRDYLYKTLTKNPLEILSFSYVEDGTNDDLGNINFVMSNPEKTEGQKGVKFLYEDNYEHLRIHQLQLAIIKELGRIRPAKDLELGLIKSIEQKINELVLAHLRVDVDFINNIQAMLTHTQQFDGKTISSAKKLLESFNQFVSNSSLKIRSSEKQTWVQSQPMLFQDNFLLPFQLEQAGVGSSNNEKSIKSLMIISASILTLYFIYTLVNRSEKASENKIETRLKPFKHDR